jgi:hypothetical protein
MKIKIEIFSGTYFQVLNKSRKVQINISNQEKYIQKNAKKFLRKTREVILGQEESK